MGGRSGAPWDGDQPAVEYCGFPEDLLWGFGSIRGKLAVEQEAGGTLGVLTRQGAGTDSSRGFWTPHPPLLREDLESSEDETHDWGW